MIEREGRASQKSKGGVSKIPNTNSYKQNVKHRKNAIRPFCILPACYARRTMGKKCRSFFVFSVEC